VKPDGTLSGAEVDTMVIGLRSSAGSDPAPLRKVNPQS
jgi:hypothetical protein